MRTETMTPFAEFRVERIDNVLYVLWEWQPEEGDGDHETVDEIELPEDVEITDRMIQRALANHGWTWEYGTDHGSENGIGTAIPNRMKLVELWKNAEWATYRAQSQVKMANDALRASYAGDERERAVKEVSEAALLPQHAVEELLLEGLWDE